MCKLNKSKLLILIMVLGSLLVASFTITYASAVNEESLLVYCGAGLSKPMNEIGELFKEEFGVQIQYSFAGSAQNLSQLQLAGEGDVYMPGALYYYEQAAEKGLTVYEKHVAYHIPVIAVPKGNPANIQGLLDLTREDIEIVLGDEKSAAIGKTCQKIFQINNITEEVNRNVIAKAATVNELVVYIVMNQADAAIIWEDNVKGVKDIEIVRIADEKNDIKTIPICVLEFSQKIDLAIDFVDFVASQKGKGIFEKHGFKAVE